MRTFLIVIDSFGIGELPDADKYGDVGSDTYGNIWKETGVYLPELVSLGLNNIDGVARSDGGRRLAPVAAPRAAHARLAERTPAKDTTAGHYEIAGLVLQHPYRVYPKFPPDVVRDLEKETGVEFLGNEAASGTEIIRRLGDEHRRTGKPILYTSQDSVLQIAADTSVIPLERLYSICEAARRVMTGERAVGRVIARPFVCRNGQYIRTEDRKDYALEPPGRTLLDDLHEHGVSVIGVGKIGDIFAMHGITCTYPAHGNAECMNVTKSLLENHFNGLCFVNLVDFDMLYGHRNDAVGYARALSVFDEWLTDFLPCLHEEDALLLTADHGCDPSTPSTDHSREYVPLLLYGKTLPPKPLGTRTAYADIGATVASLLGVATYRGGGTSFF